MQLSNLNSQSDGLIARQNANGLILLAIFPSGGLIAIFSDLNYVKEWYNNFSFGAIFMILFLSVSTLYLWFKILDKRVKLIINQEGIWMRKYGLVLWEIIESYHFETISGKTMTYILWIETTTIGVSMKIEITYLDKDSFAISNAIKQYSNSHELRYSGHSRSEI